MLDLGAHALRYTGKIHRNLAPAALVEHALRRGEGELADNGALVAYTGAITGRSPRDRFLVSEPPSKEQIDWGAVNHPLEPAAFQRLAHLLRAYLQNRDLFVFDAVKLMSLGDYLTSEAFRLFWEREGWPTGDMTAEHWNRLTEIVRG